jgi:hypothetical protein
MNKLIKQYTLSNIKTQQQFSTSDKEKLKKDHQDNLNFIYYFVARWYIK